MQILRFWVQLPYTVFIAANHNMVTTNSPLKTETDKKDQNPPMATHEYNLWTHWTDGWLTAMKTAFASWALRVRVKAQQDYNFWNNA